MPPIARNTLRSRWFAGCVHAGIWLLLCLAVVHLGGKAPELREASAVDARVESPAPIGALERLFSSGAWPTTLGSTNTVNPFATRHFIPPAPPPPPTTRTVEVTYQGYYQAGEGPKHTMFRLGNDIHVASPGAQIETNLFIAEATMQALTLTNLAAETNILLLNMKKALVVPIR